MIVMKRVVHLGPSESKGGMATVIANMARNPPKGWSAEIIPTHSDNLIGTIFRWISAANTFSYNLRKHRYDLVHIHVTHSMSWWRKLGFMKKCEKNGVPLIIHIHSGKFDTFCARNAGKSVERELSKAGRKTVVLEERWLNRLSPWIPSDSEVLHNFSSPVSRSSNHVPSRKLRLLILSRNSSVKNHDFAVDVAKCISEMGREVCLTMTGWNRIDTQIDGNLELKKCGWVSEEEREKLLAESDFLLSPSDFEGSSMSVIESMVSGLPCLVSETSKETIGVEDLVISESDPRKWATKILHISNREEYLRIVELVRRHAERYNPEVNINKIGEIYDRLLVSDNGD